MNNKVAKIKKVLHTILILLLLAFMIAFGFHFSCRLKSEGDGHTICAGNSVTCATRIA